VVAARCLSTTRKHNPPLQPQHKYSLGLLPTPLHLWKNVPGVPEGVAVWIKRDDLTGMQLSGNKVRKLEFLLADAVDQRADCVITIGGIQVSQLQDATTTKHQGLENITGGANCPCAYHPEP